ncbi:class II aldolase/adducin family protein [Bacteriovoracaceae bacterium]|nr:class II aldolase/adducin family protein [Bacteriovoracaceae bacterium]
MNKETNLTDMILDEGVIKFNYELIPAPPIELHEYQELENWRKKLFKLKLIGEYPIEKVGYGNISKRTDHSPNSFLITGSQTGHHKDLKGDHYTLILNADLQKQNVTAKGPIKPSSESLTHFAIYKASLEIKYVFHAHSAAIWKYMVEHNNDFDQTSENIGYGTLEMAEQVQSLIGNKTYGTIVMKGHQDGIIAYAKTPEECGSLLIDLVERSQL